LALAIFIKIFLQIYISCPKISLSNEKILLQGKENVERSTPVILFSSKSPSCKDEESPKSSRRRTSPDKGQANKTSPKSPVQNTSSITPFKKARDSLALTQKTPLSTPKAARQVRIHFLITLKS
jgi:hypothetical protein